jgi:hypothetical protein
VAAALAAASAPAVSRGWLDGAPPGHTGGFGEPTCQACHRAPGPEAGEPRLTLLVPAAYAPGEEVAVQVRVEGAGLRRAGFQLAARWAGGEAAGRQAGALAATDDRVAVVASASGILYAGHSAAGTVARGAATWRLRWTAPAEASDAVVFHAAANAGNDDDSALGDAVALATARSEPGGSASPDTEPGGAP